MGIHGYTRVRGRTRRRRFAAVAFLAAAALSGSAPAVDLMPTSELRAGMRGKGRTVFQGTRIEQFDVEILGVLRDAYGPRRDVILARADVPALKGGPIAGGMSGSPVYVKGKLIGAIAITWAFAKGGYCGITPIHEMLADAASPRAARPPARQAAAPVPPSRLARLMGLAEGSPAERPAADGATLRRILTPVMVSHGSPRLLEALDPFLRAQGFMLMRSGAPGPLPSGPVRLRPGSSVGVRLIGGDLNYTAIGTVTCLRGRRVLAFGHPFLDEGDVSAPMTAAYVHAVVPSYYYPMKMAVGTASVGRTGAASWPGRSARRPRPSRATSSSPTAERAPSTASITNSSATAVTRPTWRVSAWRRRSTAPNRRRGTSWRTWR